MLKGHARFQVQNGEGISAYGDCERIERDQIALLVSEYAAEYYLAGACLLVTEAAQSCRAAGEECLADGKRAVYFVNHPVLVAVARIENIRQAQSQASCENRAAQTVQPVVTPVACLKFVEREVAAKLAQCYGVVQRQKLAARGVKLVVARVAHERKAEARKAHLAVGPKYRRYQQAVDVVKAHILIAVARKR